MIELDPRHAGGWYNLGRMRQELGDLAGAVEDWRRALGLFPPGGEWASKTQRHIEDAQRLLEERGGQ